MILSPGQDALIPSGIKAKVPTGRMLMANDKSGICSKKKLKVGAKIVDEDYQGEIHIHVFNIGLENVLISPGEKIVQFILVPVDYDEPEECSTWEEVFGEVSERGEGGFGHTGTK